MNVSTVRIRSENLTLTQQNLNLRQKIATLRNERLKLQHKLVEAIGAKESFKVEVIKLITQAQNTFERLKTFIEHTTSTPPRPQRALLPLSSSLLSDTEKLLRRQIVGTNNFNLNYYNNHHHQRKQQQQKQQYKVLRQIPILKDAKQIPIAQQTPVPVRVTPSMPIEGENTDMHFIEEKIRKLNTVLKECQGEISCDIEKMEQNSKKTPTTIKKSATSQTPPVGRPATNSKLRLQNQRYSTRLKNIQSPSNKEIKKNLEMAFKDITNSGRIHRQFEKKKSELNSDGDQSMMLVSNTKPRKRKMLA